MIIYHTRVSFAIKIAIVREINQARKQSKKKFRMHKAYQAIEELETFISMRWGAYRTMKN